VVAADDRGQSDYDTVSLPESPTEDIK
jgi:hypothetical protein